MYDKLEYNPTIGGLLVDKYPELTKYVEFSDKLGDKLLRFCILYFDEDSPFAKNRDLEDKRLKVYEVIKADIEVRKEIESEGDRYKEVVYRWFNLHHSYVFMEWWSRKTDFTQNNLYLASNLSTSPDPEKVIQQKRNIKANLESDRNALLGLENSLFKDEKSRQLLTKAANEASLSGYAERYAKNFFEDLENQ